MRTDYGDNLFFRELYLRLLRAMDVIILQPKWDQRTLVVAGRSQSGGEAIAVAGLNEKVTFILAHIPAMCDMTGMPLPPLLGMYRKCVYIDKGFASHFFSG